MEKNYIDHYIEILTNTMNDAVVRNISLQANAKMTDIAIGQLNEKVIELENEINKHSNNTSSVEENYKSQIVDYERIVNELNAEISRLNSLKSDYENIKNQVSHIDTFRNELIKERQLHEKTRIEFEDQIKELNDKINYLQLTPAKRKKIEDANKKVDEPNQSSLEPIMENVKDGGVF